MRGVALQVAGRGEMSTALRALQGMVTGRLGVSRLAGGARGVAEHAVPVDEVVGDPADVAVGAPPPVMSVVTWMTLWRDTVAPVLPWRDLHVVSQTSSMLRYFLQKPRQASERYYALECNLAHAGHMRELKVDYGGETDSDY